jgi:nitrate/nitrite-specific signal transduction histidine kinase
VIDHYEVRRWCACAPNHAQAKNIVVDLNYGRTRFSVCVRDDGRGIDPNILASGGREGHFGLQGMRERAQKIGAELSLSSRDINGTEIKLSIPAHIAYASPQTNRLSRLLASIIPRSRDSGQTLPG